MSDKRFGVLPWTTFQFELQLAEFRDTFPPEFSKFPETSSLKIVHPAQGQLQSMVELERTVTTFLRYFVGLGNYDPVIWIGADNVAVALNYLRLLIPDREIKLTKNGALRSISDVMTDIFANIQYECEQNKRKALIIYSAAEDLECPNSWKELYPFLPEDYYPNIDYMILTLQPGKFVKLLNDPESTVMIACWLQSELIRSSSRSTEQIWLELLRTADETSRKALNRVLLLVSFLYPNNMTEEFVAEAIEYIAKKDELVQSQLQAALDKLIKSYVVRRVYVGGSIVEALCIDRQFQEKFRAGVFALERAAMAASLQQFFVSVVEEADLSDYDLNLNTIHPHHILFLPYGSGDVQFPGTEVAMHQSWLWTVSAVELVRVQPASLLMHSVVEYVNLFIIGKISMFHRQKPLGQGNFKVFEGYMYEAGEKDKIAVKCIPRQHGAEKKLKREIKNLKKLNFSNHVVGFCGVEAEPRGSTYIALELCNGTLGQWVQEKGKVDLAGDLDDLAQRIRLLRDATQGLQYLVTVGIIHRDIKPANILVKQKGANLIAKLADFDLSKYVGEDATATLTNPFGTEGFRAPELCNGLQRGTHESDMYSFGKVCYFVLSCGGTHQDDNAGPVDFDFDFYGAAKTVQALLAPDPAERPTAQQLVKYPMFWIADKCDHDKFADFIAKVIIDYGTDGSDFHEALRQIPVDWQDTLKKAYGKEIVEEAINYRQGADPSKPARAKKCKEGVGQEFGPDCAGYLRFTRNAIMHAVDRFRDSKSSVTFWNRYMDSSTGKPKKWEYFETYFKLFPELFFGIWKLAHDFTFSMSPENFGTIFEQLCGK